MEGEKPNGFRATSGTFLILKQVLESVQKFALRFQLFHLAAQCLHALSSYARGKKYIKLEYSSIVISFRSIKYVKKPSLGPINTTTSYHLVLVYGFFVQIFCFMSSETSDATTFDNFLHQLGHTASKWKVFQAMLNNNNLNFLSIFSFYFYLC